MKFENITIQHGDAIFLEEASFELQKGTFYCMIGKNGSGKSSLIHYIKRTYNKDFAIRILPQNPEPSQYSLTVEDALKSFCLLEKIFEWEGKIEEYLEKLDLNTKRYQSLNTLSGGERQRVFLAQALIGKTDVLFLDEALSGMDMHYKLDIFDLLVEEAQKKNNCIVLIEHQFDLLIEKYDILFCRTKTKKISLFEQNSKEVMERIKEELEVEKINGKWARVKEIPL